MVKLVDKIRQIWYNPLVFYFIVHSFIVPQGTDSSESVFLILYKKTGTIAIVDFHLLLQQHHNDA